MVNSNIKFQMKMLLPVLMISAMLFSSVSHVWADSVKVCRDKPKLNAVAVNLTNIKSCCVQESNNNISTIIRIDVGAQSLFDACPCSKNGKCPLGDSFCCVGQVISASFISIDEFESIFTKNDPVQYWNDFSLLMPSSTTLMADLRPPIK